MSRNSSLKRNGFKVSVCENMKVIGNFANGTDLSVYQLKVLKTISPINTVSNSTGEIWIIVGTDSGFESTTTIFYNTIKVNIK